LFDGVVLWWWNLSDGCLSMLSVSDVFKRRALLCRFCCPVSLWVLRGSLARSVLFYCGVSVSDAPSSTTTVLSV
jgi:hypothetical protein